MYSLIAFATQWGSKHGGINSFNADFVGAFGFAYSSAAQVICVVTSATPEEIEEARATGVTLVTLPYAPSEKVLNGAHATAAIDQLRRRNISHSDETTVWLGHDRITGAAAIAAARAAGGRAALIHHMSYAAYESYAENSRSANHKEEQQKALFRQADLVLAVGPLLRDALLDLLGNGKPVCMLIPGLADIVVRDAPRTFAAFLSGRLSDDATRIKQGHLGIAGFAQAQREASEAGMPDALCRQPKLVLRGVDFESQVATIASSLPSDPETDLKQFAEAYADRVINLHALPYTQDRQELYAELSAASVALMPSWHEGFGLVAWEAIAAGVPLIVGRHSGVYRLLENEHPGVGPGCVYPVDVQGTTSSPFFHKSDLKAIVASLKAVAKDPDLARRKAAKLREEMSRYTWPACVERAAEAFGWTLQKGSIVAQPAAVPSGEQSPATSGQITPQGLASSVSPIGDDGPLRIPEPVWQRGSSMADSQLLRAEEALVPFDPARQPDLDALHEWLDDAQWREAVRLVTGAGGLGKTRLALELCRQRRDGGWAAGFLEHGLEPRDIPAAWRHLRGLSKPILIAIDYAETRQSVLFALVKSMLQSPLPGTQQVRLLLLARNAGEWWDRLPSKDPVTEAFLDGYATSGPARLPSLHAATIDRRSAYAKALNAFATRLGIGTPTVMPDLTAEHFGRPLYLQMAALLALHGERPASAEGLTKALLNHETRYWRGVLAPFAWAEPERQAAQLLALTTLAGGFATPREAQAYWATAGDNTQSSSDLATLFHALAPLYAGRQGLQPVRPDLLGEALVAQVLLRSEASQLLDAVLSQRASESVRRHALTVLTRLASQRLDVHEIVVDALVRQFPHCVHDVVAVATESTGQLARLAEAAFARLAPQPKSQVAGLLGSRLAEDSVQLSGLYLLVSGHQVEKWRKKKERKKLGSADLADFAGSLMNYSVALSRTGNYDQALVVAGEAFKVFQILAQADRQRHDPDYAMSLSNYAARLSDVGRSEDALEHAQQALEIRRRLAQARPDRHDPDYAMSLSNYAARLSDVGRSEDALEHAQQALEIRRRLAQARPDRYEPDYAASLNNYANGLGDVGRSEEALEHAQQALEIHRRLAQARPDRHDPDYAASLNNYAARLSDVGRSEDALEHAQQAQEFYRRLAQARPDRYEPDYAMSLSNYAAHLGDVGRSEEALEHAQQALEIRRRLAQARPDRHDPDYAMSLSNYAARLSDVGRSEDALEHAQQALEIRRRLAQARPDRYEPDYAASLNNYANRLGDVGRSEEALEHAQQALEIHRRLAQMRPDRHDPDYAMSLSNYAARLSDVGRSEEALEHAQQAQEIHRRLAQARPDRYEPDYAMSLSNYAAHLGDVGRSEEALEHAQQALEIRRRLAQARPDRHDPDYAMSLSNYAARLSDVGRSEDALEHAQQAQEIHRRLSAKRPLRFEGNLFDSDCSVQFLSWLADRSAGDWVLPNPNALPETIPLHRRPVFALYAAFVRACLAPDEASRAEGFKRVVSAWSILPVAGRAVARDCWLCAAAWCAVSAREAVAQDDWHGEWRSFVSRRQGRVPNWMVKVAQRLSFQWPV